MTSQSGTNGADNLAGTNGPDSLEGLGGDDQLQGYGGDDTLLGGDGNDELDGGEGSDRIEGGAGDDRILTGDGDDIVLGGEGVDWVNGEPRAGGRFVYWPASGALQISGGGGDDFLYGGTGPDLIEGDEGDDILKGAEGNDRLEGGAGNDNLDGGPGDDILSGGEGGDRLISGEGRDTLMGGAGNDEINGYIVDSDTYNYWNHGGPVDADGGEGDDFIYGSSGNDDLKGSAGDDIIYGGLGNDRLDGGPGADAFFGGAGDDAYVVDHLSDQVTDSQGRNTGLITIDFYKPSPGVSWTLKEGVKPIPYWIDALVEGGSALGDAYLIAQDGVLRYAFPSTTLASWNATDSSGFTPFNSAQRAFVRQTFDYISSVLNLRFEEVADASQPGVLSFANNAQKASAGYATGSYSGDKWAIFLNNEGVSARGNLNPVEGDYAALTIIHEIGHALGLKHPHDQAAGETSASDPPYLGAIEDRTTFTQMSYNDLPEDYYPVFRDLDIAALHYLYGPAQIEGTRPNQAGDTRYVLTTSWTNFIWDGGGIDTLDARSANQRLTLSLAPGAHSYFGASPANLITAPAQVTINLGTRIENVEATPFDDEIRGNDAPNRLDGGAGNDLLWGLEGDDVLIGGLGDDQLFGGAGDDLLDGGLGDDVAEIGAEFAACQISFDGELCRITAPQLGTDILTNIERVTFRGDTQVDKTIADLKALSAQNGAPRFVLVPQSLTLQEDTSLSFRVDAEDPNGDPLSFSLTGPSYGRASISEGRVTYTPNPDFSGEDSLSLTVSDSQGAQVTQRIQLVVQAVNDAPQFTSPLEGIRLVAGSLFSWTLVASDRDGDALTYRVTGAQNGSVSLIDNQLIYQASAFASGVDQLSVTVQDPFGASQTQLIQIEIEPLAASSKASAFRMNVPDGWVGTIGGNGLLMGTLGFQNIQLLFGTLILDASFNRGGDLITLPGEGSFFQVERQGSALQISAGDAFRATIPVGTAQSYLAFDDGVRSLKFSDGGIRLGGQILSTSQAILEAKADAVAPSFEANPNATARLFLLGSATQSEQAHVTLGGRALVYGTMASDVVALARNASVHLSFDASFNRGGDIIILGQEARAFEAVRMGSSVLLTSADQSLNIPVGTSGLTLRFLGEDRTLIFSQGSMRIGAQVIEASQAPLFPFTNIVSIDAGTAEQSLALSGANGSILFEDDAGRDSFVMITNFSSGDLIRVTGAPEDAYSFSSRDVDGDGVADDLAISYSNPATGAVNDIEILNLVSPSSFVQDRASAILAAGFNFISFG